MLRLFIPSEIELLTVVRQCRQRLRRFVSQPGRHDVVLSMIVAWVFLAPLLAEPVAAQVGISAAEQVLCAEGGNIAQLIGLSLILASAYFSVKIIVQLQYLADKRWTKPPGRDPQLNAKKKREFEKFQVRDTMYSVVGALLPVLYPVLLNAAGINVVGCLFPEF